MRSPKVIIKLFTFHFDLKQIENKTPFLTQLHNQFQSRAVHSSSNAGTGLSARKGLANHSSIASKQNSNQSKNKKNETAKPKAIAGNTDVATTKGSTDGKLKKKTKHLPTSEIEHENLTTQTQPMDSMTAPRPSSEHKSSQQLGGTKRAAIGGNHTPKTTQNDGRDGRDGRDGKDDNKRDQSSVVKKQRPKSSENSTLKAQSDDDVGSSATQGKKSKLKKSGGERNEEDLSEKQCQSLFSTYLGRESSLSSSGDNLRFNRCLTLYPNLNAPLKTKKKSASMDHV